MLTTNTSPDPIKPMSSHQGTDGSTQHTKAGTGYGLASSTIGHIAASVGHFNSAIEDVFQTFWGQPISVRLVSVSPETQYFWRYDNFYVSQASSDIQLRMSDTGCSALLIAALGEKEPAQPFAFSTITGFEASLLTTFSREVLTLLAKRLIQPKALAPNRDKTPVTEQQTTKQESMIHLVWAFRPQVLDVSENHQKEDIESGKLILSLPLNALRAEILQPQTEKKTAYSPIQTAWLYHALCPVELSIGTGQMPIGALEQLETDDVLVLEQSRIDQLLIVHPLSKTQSAFPIRLRWPERITRYPATQHDPSTQDQTTMTPITDPTAHRQALLDNLMIDVGAQFTPVKMPLHQIKQMSEGLVVEIGDLAQNEVLLTVEGKPLALGELVIVGDKFGVRVVSLTPDGESVPTREVKSYPAPVPESMKHEAPETQAHQAQEHHEEHYQEPVQQQVNQQHQPAPQAQPQAEASDDFLDDDFGDDDDDW